MPRFPPSRVLALAAACLALLSCAVRSGADSGPKGPNLRLATARLGIGAGSILVELARSPSERETGLMFRKSLPEGEGMLFVFPQDERLSFWMKNTSIPLSIAYISSDGRIREIHELEPFSLAPVAAERSVRYALEVPRGWFERAVVSVGDSLVLPRLD